MSNPQAPLSRTKTIGHGLDVFVPKTEEEQTTSNRYRIAETTLFALIALGMEVFIITIYAVWFGYLEPDLAAEEDFDYLYNLFRDVSIMIFFGFGFLMTFLRRYGYSAIGYTFLISALVVQWSIILNVFWVAIDDNFDYFSSRIGIAIHHLLDGCFCAGAVMISYGAVLGKVTPTQMLVLGIIEPFFYWLNIYICSFQLEAFDIGGGFYIHTFGAYFGLAVCFFITSKKSRGHPDNTSCYSADIFSLAGTLFLWLLWPSFNAVIAPPGEQRLRAVVNTYLSLCGATVMSFVMSRVVTGGKFDPVHIQNSTLAGGVVMGVAAHLELYPATVIGIGMLAGLISVLGYHFLTPFLNNYLHIQDICGVHNLHGMPGVLGALVSIFASLVLSQENIDNPEFSQGDWQPFFQLATLGITLGIAIASGILTGMVLLGVSFLNPIHRTDFYNDREFWNLPSDYEYVVRAEDEEDA